MQSEAVSPQRLSAPTQILARENPSHTDFTRIQFNYSEILGNSTVVAISEAYDPDNRDVTDAAANLGRQIGVDMASNVLKGFWAAVSREFSGKTSRVSARLTDAGSMSSLCDSARPG